MAANNQTFEEAVQEFIDLTKGQIGEECEEHLPPGFPSPYRQDGPPYEFPLRLDERTISDYALSIGDRNPLFTDPEYGRKSRYGSQLAPGPILAMVHYPTVHGRSRPEGYPLANFISATAWEFYDVIRVGSKFRSSKATRELIEKQGSQGKLLFLIAECNYWDYHGDLPAKCYGTQIMVPIPSMGNSRAMDRERIGEHMMYERKASQYSPEQIEEIIGQIKGFPPRGAEPRYWEDVEVGDKIGPFVLPPWSLQDQVAYHSVGYCTTNGERSHGDEEAFEPAFRKGRRETRMAREHPITRWPWTPPAEHEDALLAIYRGQPGPFDFGVQRVQIPQQLLTNWMGDEGFIRRLYIAMRKPVYYGDVTIYTGEVMKKYKEVQEGEDAPGAAPGKAEYHAIGIRIDGVNQVGEAQAPGTATVYLPSREAGPVQLPIPHPANPPYVNYETHRRDWY